MNIMQTEARHGKQVRVKRSHYRPGQALSVPGGWGPKILRQSAHEGGKVGSPTHRPPLPPGNIPGTRARVRPEGCQLKIPMTPSGIEPATFRFVAQCLNHCATACEIILPTLVEIISSQRAYITLSKGGWKSALLCLNKDSIQSNSSNFVCWSLKKQHFKTYAVLFHTVNSAITLR
jgi:hypothetical protein